MIHKLKSILKKLNILLLNSSKYEQAGLLPTILMYI